LTIDASNLPDGITISGQNQTTPFLVRAACHFDNLTITDGYGDISVFTPNYGGGIDIQYFPNETPSSEGSLSLCHCTIIGNNSSKGGIAAEAKPKAINDPPTNILWMNKCTATLNDPAGVEATAAGVFISNSQLSFNTRNGLALFRSNIQGPTPGRCELVMEDSNLVGNAEAGLYCIDATGLTVRRCSLNANLNHGLHAELFTNGVIEDTTFSFNTTSGSGGGALLESSDLVFRRCTFHNNEASSGGAVFSSAPYNQNNASDLEFVNCTFSANTAS
ncbi:MAG: right-handed parallel beta-helix repeat-containing protein, partial [Verrucomicrobiota bacterium]